MSFSTPPATTTTPIVVPPQSEESLSRTAAVEPCPGSALDPLVQEVTWMAWELTSADPAHVTEMALRRSTGGFDALVEHAWSPGRTVVITELATVPDGTDSEMRLAVRLAIGVFGSTGTTSVEAEGLRPVAETLVGHRCSDSVHTARRIDPATVVGKLEMSEPGPASTALIRQRSLTVDAGVHTVEVLSRFNPTVEPWGHLAHFLVRIPTPVRVRATVLATELSPMDRLELDEAVRRLTTVLGADPRAEDRFQLERAHATITDLRASFATPLLISEISVTSPEPLTHTLLRTIAGTFTSDADVLRQQGHVVVAGQRLLLGGHEIDRDPANLPDALHRGLPLRGGLEPRGLRDLLTLSESPIGWPVPMGQCLPSVPLDATHCVDVPVPLRAGAGVATLLTAPEVEPAVSLPVELRTRHTLVTGAWGSGKSTAMARLTLDDLAHGRGFLWIDPHGTTADWVVAQAEHLGVKIHVLDAADASSDRFAPIGRLAHDAGNRDEIDTQISHLVDGLASTLPPEWTGPRWKDAARALLQVHAALEVDLDTLLTWLNDGDALRQRLGDDRISDATRSRVALLCRPGSNDAAEVRHWVTCKFHDLVSGPAKHLLAPAGEGISVADAVLEGTPIVVNLAALPTSEAATIGHLLLASVRDIALARDPGFAPTYTCFVDEAHRFPDVGLARIIAEGRKFGLGLVLATQSLTQVGCELTDLALAVGTHVTFRATPGSAQHLAPLIQISPEKLIRLPDLHGLVTVQGHPAIPVSFPAITPPPIERHKTPRRL